MSENPENLAALACCGIAVLIAALSLLIRILRPGGSATCGECFQGNQWSPCPTCDGTERTDTGFQGKGHSRNITAKAWRSENLGYYGGKKK
jgi:hypothetical protein